MIGVPNPMFSLTFSSRILKEAQSRGLIETSCSGSPASRVGVEGSVQASYWGAHLASLVETGKMPEEMLNSIAWDVIAGKSGSWLDPFFQGPVPVGDLPGLGDRYRDLVLLGEGATAHVYKALDTLLQRQVAIKVLKQPDGPSLVEARAQAQVEHPNICHIYEVGKGFIVMQLVEGPTLAHQATNLDLGEKLRIVRDVALGVHAAHQKGLIHLDLKLNNILIQKGEDGVRHPIVSDFGMVRGEIQDPSAGCPMGTPPFTSPEQLQGDLAGVGRSTDVYALGVILYVLLTGTIPFEIQSFQGLLDAIRHASPTPLRSRMPELPKDLARIVHHCMEKSPNNRYPTAKDLAIDLDRFLRAEPVQVMGGGRIYRITKWVRRNRNLRWASVIALFIILGIVAITSQRNRHLVQQAEWHHHFQKIVEEMRGDIDQMYRLPAHNIEQGALAIQKVLNTLDAERLKGGRSAEGPGYLALGQAHFLLDVKDKRAAVYLQKAWDAGYRVESVRSWLALTLIRRYQAERRAILAEPDIADSQALRLDACRQHLKKARLLLIGRASPDQARLTHLIELAENASSDLPDYDRQIQLARNYRTRFPNDMDGMLEEAEALNIKADALAQKAAITSVTYPPACGTIVEPLRQTAGEILNQLVQIAPSHPGAYSALAHWYQRQDLFPTEQTPPPPMLHKQARKWLEAGLAVSPHHAQLIYQYSTFASSRELVYRLEHGLDPTPIAEKLKSLFRKAIMAPDRLARIDVALALCSYAWTCRLFGKPTDLSLPDVVHQLLHDPWPAEGLHPLILGPTIGRLMLETGQDPRPCLEELLLSKSPLNALDARTRAILNLTLVEYAWMQRQEAWHFLAQAKVQVQIMKPGTQFRNELDVSIRKWEAILTQDAALWVNLEKALETIERAPSEPSQVFSLAFALDARLAMAQHQLEAGKDTRGTLITVRRALNQLNHAQALPLPYKDRYLAELCLLEAHSAKNPVPVILEGLAASRRLVKALTPGSAEQQSRHQRSRPTIYLLDLPGRPLKTQGELLLALGKFNHRPDVRSHWARKAEAAFRQAIQINGNLRKQIAPFLEQTQALQSSSGDTRARS